MTPGSQAAALERGGLRPATWGRGPWPHRAHVPSPPVTLLHKRPPCHCYAPPSRTASSTDVARARATVCHHGARGWPGAQTPVHLFPTGTEAPRPPPWGRTPLPCKGGEGGADRPQQQSKTRLSPLAGGGAAPPAGSRLRATRNQGSRGGWPPARPSRTPAPCLDGLSGRLVARRAMGRWPDPTPPPVPAVKLSSTWSFRQAYSPPP